MASFKVYTELTGRGPSSASRVIDGIAASKKIVILYGAGASVFSGIPAFRHPGAPSGSTLGLWSEYVIPPQPGQAGVKGSDLFKKSSRAKGRELQAINKLMTGFRIQARDAPLSPFHSFVHRAMDAGIVTKCITRNFDGLETRDRPDLAERVLMIHGDNRVLTCTKPNSGDTKSNCRDISGEDVVSLDQCFLNGQNVCCPECSQARDMLQKAGKRVVGQVDHLRPAVLLDESMDAELQGGPWLKDLLKEVEGCDLLLVSGTSLKTSGAYNLVQDLATVVRDSEGAVVFIDLMELAKSRFKQFIDFHLQIDIQLCAEAIMRAMDKASSEVANDIWRELSEGDLEGEHESGLPPLSIPVCCQCGLALEGVIFPCVNCGVYFCFEDGQRAGTMCVSLDYFAEETSPLPFHERVQGFQCYDCFEHQDGIYPHFVRHITTFYKNPSIKPRLVLIVYYLAKFWPLAEHLMGSVTSVWKMAGWAYYTAPIKLQALEYQIEVLPQCQWEPNTFSTMVIYVTHGLAGSRNYQLADNLEVGPTQFLNATLQPIQRLVHQSKFTCGYLMACGHIYTLPENVANIQAWVDEGTPFHSLVGTMNTRLSPAYLANLVAQSALNLLGYSRWDGPGLLDLWLRDSLACTHTDLVYFGRGEKPRTFYYSPFQFRPLGKDLPNLLSVCKCTGNSTEGATGQRKQKIWRVTHNGSNRSPLKDVVVTASCSLCRTKFRLQKPDLLGTLHKCGGLHAAEVPYFYPDTL